MTDFTTHVADGIDLLISPVTFDAGTGVATLVGGTAVAFAKNLTTGVSTAAASCTVASATSVRATWTPGSLAAANYNVQVRATPLGFAVQTLSDTDWIIKASN